MPNSSDKHVADRTIIKDAKPLDQRVQDFREDFQALIDAKGHKWDAIFLGIAEQLGWDKAHMSMDILTEGPYVTYPMVQRVMKTFAEYLITADWDEQIARNKGVKKTA